MKEKNNQDLLSELWNGSYRSGSVNSCEFKQKETQPEPLVPSKKEQPLTAEEQTALAKVNGGSYRN